jgi:molecular chaperone GrpE
VSDTPHREPDPQVREDTTDGFASFEEDHGDPDAIGAWPNAAGEAGSMPEPSSDEGPREEPPAEAEEDTRSREELLAALGEAEQQRDEYLDGVRRARAEFENYRKRTMREGASQRESGKAELAEGLLEVLDDLDRTVDAAAASSDEGLARGVELVAEKLVRSLQGSGLERVDATGVVFDPNRHEAVQQTPADEPVEQPIVAQVLRPGYVLGDRVLRAAMVVVEQ